MNEKAAYVHWHPAYGTGNFNLATRRPNAFVPLSGTRSDMRGGAQPGCAEYAMDEVKVNAMRQVFEKMSQEIEGLRKILGGHEQELADAGVIVESAG